MCALMKAAMADKPRNVLYKLVVSEDPWQRRTAIVSTWFFIRQRDTHDTFHICAMLVDEPHEYVRKAMGSWLRTAGNVNPDGLIAFLDKHASRLPRISLRMATAKLPKAVKEKYLK